MSFGTFNIKYRFITSIGFSKVLVLPVPLWAPLVLSTAFAFPERVRCITVKCSKYENDHHRRANVRTAMMESNIVYNVLPCKI